MNHTATNCKLPSLTFPLRKLDADVSARYLDLHTRLIKRFEREREGETKVKMQKFDDSCESSQKPGRRSVFTAAKESRGGA